MKEAKYYEKLEDGRIHCLLCPHHCKISPGKVGICRVRKNLQGILSSQSYGIISSWGLDPIEKKPLYHYYPGRHIFSIGSVGCNFRCKFCQNWQIAQRTQVSAVEMSPGEVVEEALRQPENLGIAYTYNEPTVGYEFVLECAEIARKRGLKNVLITNGFMEKEPLEELLPYIDAMNIDVKGYTEAFYRDMTSGSLGAVKQTVERACAQCHVEITTLVIPGMNDEDSEIRDMAGWLSGLRRDIPLHLSRYFPSYQLDIRETPVTTVERARQVALEHLDYVYTGNGADPGSGDTYCPRCGNPVISRRGYRVKIHLSKGRCPHCGEAIAVIM